MKKMPYAIIFVIVLALLVFAGCMSFSPVTTETTTDPGNTAAGDATTDSDTQQQSTEALPTDTNGVTVEAPSTKEDEATDKSDDDVTTTKKDDSTAPTTVSPVTTAKSEFDIFISGNFYCTGNTTDSTGVSSPLEMAITDNSVYMLAEIDGAKMGIMVSDGTTYMISPSKSAYLELSPTILKLMDMDPDELIDSSSLKFENVKALDEAQKVTDTVFGGKDCKCYIFDSSTGASRFYIDENDKLLGFDTVDTAGTIISSTQISSVTGTVPADKIAPPSNYTAYKGASGAIKFMTLIAEDLGL